MEINETLTKLRDVKTMPELDALRTETAEVMLSGGRETFEKIQTAFRKAKNRLKRIPLSHRSW